MRARSGAGFHHYYHCRNHHHHGDAACAHKRSHRAADVEGAVWDLVAGLLRDSERLRVSLDAMIEAERAGRRGDPGADAAAWAGRIAALDRKRARLQDMAAEGHLTFEELGAKLRETDEARRTAERELAEVEGRRDRIEQLERDRDALLEHYADMVPEALDDLTGEERHQVYRMLRLTVYLHPDGDLEAEGVLREPVCMPTGTSRSSLIHTGSGDPGPRLQAAADPRRINGTAQTAQNAAEGPEGTRPARRCKGSVTRPSSENPLQAKFGESPSHALR